MGIEGGSINEYPTGQAEALKESPDKVFDSELDLAAADAENEAWSKANQLLAKL